MEYRALGKSGLKVSALCLGTMSFGEQTDEEESCRIMDKAIDEGVNFFDTADVYSRGKSEQIVGRFLARGHKRDKVVLATKVCGDMGPWAPNNSGSSRFHIMNEVDASLQRLKSDHIDLYQLHWMDFSTPIEESMRALNDVVTAGKVRYIGCSKFAPAWLVEALMTADRNGWARFISEQPPYNLLDRRIENELTWTCMKHGVGIIPWGPVAAGILSGKYTKEGGQPEGSRFSQLGSRLTTAAIDAADALKPIAAEKGVTLAELCLAWVLRQRGITSPITGPRSLAQFESSLKALDVNFSDDDYERIDDICPPGSHVSDYYDINVFKPYRAAAGIRTRG